ncbi:unnamed protein product [Amoebophrya sp. A25]|nr:unnamed protein product [Amoebophrya sp. A25]|eukprot:GSA25T00016191001.1
MKTHLRSNLIKERSMDVTSGMEQGTDKARPPTHPLRHLIAHRKSSVAVFSLCRQWTCSIKIWCRLIFGASYGPHNLPCHDPVVVATLLLLKLVPKARRNMPRPPGRFHHTTSATYIRKYINGDDAAVIHSTCKVKARVN